MRSSVVMTAVGILILVMIWSSLTRETELLQELQICVAQVDSMTASHQSRIGDMTIEMDSIRARLERPYVR